MPRLLLSALGLAALAAAAPNCPPSGPVFEPPHNLASSPAIQAALANITAAFSARDRDPSVVPNTTSYSVQIFSASSAAPVGEWYRTAPALAAWGVSSGSNSSGTWNTSTAGSRTAADKDTVYRLGSLTKIFTVLTWLVQDGDAKFNDPITKYVPELAAVADRATADPVQHVAWHDVTIGALASQLSGAVRDYALMGEVSQQMDQSAATGLGFPPLNASDPTLPTCGEWPQCNRADFFRGLVQVYPSYAPFTTPAYTNTGFQILAYALEGIKGKRFQDMVQESVLTPLGLNHTYFNSPPETVGIIPGSPQNASWAYQLGDESPAGNMYSSVADLAAFGRAILGSTLIPPILTRRWLKPAALTSELVASVGYPWGIRRVSVPEANGKRVFEAYTKAGRIGYYVSLLTLLPDYDLGLAVLLAGPSVSGNAHFDMADLIGGALVPALETAAREQADARYGGVYHAAGTNSSLEIRTQPDRPGLGIFNWVSNGTDMEYIAMALQGGYTPVQPTIRLYPTGLRASDGNGGSKVSFKATFEDLQAPARPNAMFSTDCGTWVGFTSVTYGSQPLDEFIFHLDREGKVTGIEPLALRVVLEKQK